MSDENRQRTDPVVDSPKHSQQLLDRWFSRGRQRVVWGELFPGERITADKMVECGLLTREYEGHVRVYRLPVNN